MFIPSISICSGCTLCCNTVRNATIPHCLIVRAVTEVRRDICGEWYLVLCPESLRRRSHRSRCHGGTSCFCFFSQIASVLISARISLLLFSGYGCKHYPRGSCASYEGSVCSVISRSAWSRPVPYLPVSWVVSASPTPFPYPLRRILCIAAP